MNSLGGPTEFPSRTALILVGPVLGAAGFADSKLYDPDHVHLLRPRR